MIIEPDAKLMIAVATENNSLLIYQNSTLVWCAELFGETIAFQRGNFSGLSGGLVTLNSTGKIIVGYLGTDPQVFKVPPLNLSKLDYEKSKIELEEMEKEINSSVDNSGNSKPSTIFFIFCVSFTFCN
jgi:Bardet-Biedl syndrome 9 protein